MSNNPFRQYQAPQGPPPGRESTGTGQQSGGDYAPPTGPPPHRNQYDEYAPPSGPPPGRGNVNLEYAPPSGPPPGRVHQDYAPPSGPPPSHNYAGAPPGRFSSSTEEYAPPSGPPPKRQDYSSQNQDEYAPPSGPPPKRDEYAPPPGPPPGRGDHSEYAPPPGPPPNRAEYAVPPGPPPGREEYAPPPGAPPTSQLGNLSLEPPVNNAWQAVPDTTLYPPPPAFNYKFSNNNASEDDAERAAQWVDRNPLYKPGNFSDGLLAQIRSGEVRFEKPKEYIGDIIPLKGGQTQGFSRQWKIRSQANCPDTTLSPTLPIHVARLMQLKTIYYEVQLISTPSDDSILVLGFFAPPYPPGRLPGWHRGSLAVHGDDGRRFVADPDGGLDFTNPFRKDERLGIGMMFTKSDAPPTYDQVQHANAEVFFTRNGKKVGSWDLNEEVDADARGSVGLHGESDLFVAIGVCGAVNAEVFLRQEDWLFRTSRFNMAEKDSRVEEFNDVYLNLSQKPGRCRLHALGLGWKPAGGETYTLNNTEISGTQWSRAARGYECKIFSKTQGVVQLDGFVQEDFERLSKALKSFYNVGLENKEHALRGWNWGKSDFAKSEFSFNVNNKPAFEIPYSEISNTNLAGKTEVAVELTGKRTGGDQLVEMRFYIPGTTTKETEGSGEEVDELNAANLFYETLMDKAEIGNVAGESFATFSEVLFLTPRGRYDVDMYESSFRLRGKTYDYKIQYQAMKKFFLLPKPDDMHILITIGLDPPLRQGQTRYPFLVMQFKRDEEVELDLNMSQETLDEKYKDKLQLRYENPMHAVVAQIFRGLTGKRVTTASKDFVSHHQQSGVKCSIKANEGHLFCLDKAFMFVPKPATYISFENVASITMSRVGGAISASRTFDISVVLKGGQGEHQFSNINREEQQPLEDFFKLKGLKTKNEMVDDTVALAVLDDLSSDDEEVLGKADRGSADEDEESPDEDFATESDSDVAEEFDSAHESDGSGTEAGSGDDDEADVDMDDLSERELEERPKKKSKH